MGKIVLALGGNALGDSANEQLKKAQLAAKSVANLVEEGHQVVIAHGNGPQVGKIRMAFEELSTQPQDYMPFPECTAMSQGYIGYHLQQAIDEEFVSRGKKNIPVVTMLTQVVVDGADPAFQDPTKPIGGYYTQTEAEQLMKETGATYMEDAGRGYRRVVASPKPIDIYEKVSLRTLVEAHQVVIACGGGGIPIKYDGPRYAGVEAVVDKDFAAAKLAELIDADLFIILTAVPNVYLNYGTAEERALDKIDAEQLRIEIKKGQFAKGSMLPKVEAALSFVTAKKSGKSIIASLEEAKEAVHGRAGTVILNQ